MLPYASGITQSISLKSTSYQVESEDQLTVDTLSLSLSLSLRCASALSLSCASVLSAWPHGSACSGAVELLLDEVVVLVEVLVEEAALAADVGVPGGGGGGGGEGLPTNLRTLVTCTHQGREFPQARAGQ